MRLTDTLCVQSISFLGVEIAYPAACVLVHRVSSGVVRSRIIIQPVVSELAKRRMKI